MNRQTPSSGLGKILSDLSLEKFAVSLRTDFRFAPLNTLLLVAPSIQIAYQRERAVVLRFGKFRGLCKSGVFAVVPVALHLRAMNMVYEGLRQKGSMIIVPSSAVETRGLGALDGLTAFDRGLGGQVAREGDREPPSPSAESEIVS